MPHCQERIYPRREFFRQGMAVAFWAGSFPPLSYLSPKRDAAQGGKALGFSRSRRSPNDLIQVACIGLGNRGRQHLRGIEAVAGAAVVALCDVDSHVLDRRADEFQQDTGRKVRCDVDYRHLLEDRQIDAVAIATWNPTHAEIALAALAAGKDVYLEKPCASNVFEGRQLVQAVQNSRRICFHGVQCRTSPAVREAIGWLEGGLLGEVRLARVRCFAGERPPPISHAATPSGLVDDFWLGPAPQRPFEGNRFHQDWRWWGEYGNGPLGKQAFHLVDLARWGLGVAWPRRVCPLRTPRATAETFPAILPAQAWRMEFPAEKKTLIVEILPSPTPFPPVGRPEEFPEAVIFYGTEGVMELGYFGYRTFLGRLQQPGPQGQAPSQEFEHFIQAVRTGRIEPGGPDIQQAHVSSGLVHLAHIADRLNQPIEFDPTTETIHADAEARPFSSRPDRPPFAVFGNGTCQVLG